MTNQPYYDEQKQCWLIDDNGRPRQATPEEIDAYLSTQQADDDE